MTSSAYQTRIVVITVFADSLASSMPSTSSNPVAMNLGFRRYMDRHLLVDFILWHFGRLVWNYLVIQLLVLFQVTWEEAWASTSEQVFWLFLKYWIHVSGIFGQSQERELWPIHRFPWELDGHKVVHLNATILRTDANFFYMCRLVNNSGATINIACHTVTWLKSLWPSDAIWQNKSGPALA